MAVERDIVDAAMDSGSLILQRGNGLVEVTAKQLDSIVDGSAKVANLAEDVSTASKEQASASNR